MRSLLWTGVFLLLIIELALTLLLVIPFPRKFRSAICRGVSKLNLKQKLKTPIICVFLILAIALTDTTKFLAQLYQEKLLQLEGNNGEFLNVIDKHLHKEKEYKAGRNLYLAGFAMTLLFVIGRITELMHEQTELEGKLENYQLAMSMMEGDKKKDKDDTHPIKGKIGKKIDWANDSVLRLEEWVVIWLSLYRHATKLPNRPNDKDYHMKNFRRRCAFIFDDEWLEKQQNCFIGIQFSVKKGLYY